MRCFVKSKTNYHHFSFVKTRVKVLPPEVDSLIIVGGKRFEQTFILTCTVLALAMLSICFVVFLTYDILFNFRLKICNDYDMLTFAVVSYSDSLLIRRLPY